MSLAEHAPKDTTPDQAASAWQLTLTSAHADVQTGPTDAITSVGDWDGVLRHFGLDPTEFEIVDDTVRMSRWQQSRRLDNGDRDTVWLHSYKARFRRITNRVPDTDLAALTKRVHSWRPLIRKTPGTGLGAPCAQHVGWSDWQYGKHGVAPTTQRILDSFEDTIKRVKELRRIGRNIQTISIANMGDALEGCYGHYDNQLFTVELTKRQQLNGVLDLWATGIRALAPLVDDLRFVSVLSNHGEWTRQGTGGKNVTSDDDNADGYLADTLKRVFDGRPDYAHIKWVIPHDEMTITDTLHGVRAAYNHGHPNPGTAKEADWLNAQSIRLLRTERAEPRLWFLAHRHHLNVVDHGGYWRLQHPSQDEDSKWLTDRTGKWSTTGTLTCLVGEHDQAGGSLAGNGRGWSDLAVL